MPRRYGMPGRGAKMALAGLALGLCVSALTAHAASPPKLLIFGDSLVAGFGLAHEDGFEVQLGQALERAGHPVQILDGGVSGDTSAGGLARLDWALADQPDAVIVELGANDALRATDPRETEANLGAILNNLAARRVPTLLCGMLAPPNFGRAYGEQFRAVYQRLSQLPGLLFDPFFLQGIAGDPALNQADDLHPNALGVRRNVVRILPLVERLLDEVKR